MKKIFGTDHENAKKSFVFQVTILKIFGLWPGHITGSFELKAYRIYSFLFRLIFMYIFVLTQVAFFFTVDDLEKVSAALFLLLTQIALLFKIHNFLYYYERIKKVYDQISSQQFKPKTRKERRFVRAAMSRTYKLFFSFFGPAILTILLWLIVGLVSWKLPLPAYFPFETRTTWKYLATVLYQIVGISVSASYNSASDTFSVGLITHLHAQLKRLGSQLSELGHHRTLRIRPSLARELIECIEFHKVIVQCCHETEIIFRNSFFVQMIASAIIICMTLYQLVTAPVGSGYFFSMIAYLLTMAIQILLPCWIGNDIIYALTQMAFFGDISSFDKESAKYLIIFMMRSQRRIEIKAGSLFKIPLSLNNYMGLLKTSYSYFALMQSIQRNN